MPAPTLMIQGTASSVGKSLLVTALCRIFRQDGLSVAPFKSQNMALNSAVTLDGGEIGRAQAVQAQAAGVVAEVAMNPILLKPESDRRSQVVVRGRPIGTMDATEYHARKPDLLGVVRDSLDDLRSRFDLVVIEGAGSPAEVNLMDRDLVNMRVAELADAPVILVGDIDRGGVFAALVGTMELLGPRRERVAGFVINKFRGSLELLKPGLDFLSDRTGKPILGVLPYLPNLRIAAEDSLEIQKEAGSGPLVALIRFPFISNFDEFRYLPDYGLRVRFVERPSELHGASLVILPGSKNVRHDLAWMREQGLAQAVLEHARAGGRVTGICGGYEMLGTRLHDPDGVEGAPGEETGLGLLTLQTHFSRHKTTRLVSAVEAGWLPELSGVALKGYEIHHGQAVAMEAPAFQLAGGSDGSVRGNVVGTFIHGLFENEAFCQAMAARLGGRSERIEDPFDALANHVRVHLDMQRLYRLIDMKVRV